MFILLNKGEEKRLDNQRDKILNALREAGSKGVLNSELSKVALRYGGQLGILYQKGYRIDKKSLGDGVYRYTLIEEPEVEVPQRESAFDTMINEVKKIGLITAEELSWILEEQGISVRYKAGTYKA